MTSKSNNSSPWIWIIGVGCCVAALVVLVITLAIGIYFYSTFTTDSNYQGDYVFPQEYYSDYQDSYTDEYYTDEYDYWSDPSYNPSAIKPNTKIY